MVPEGGVADVGPGGHQQSRLYGSTQSLVSVDRGEQYHESRGPRTLDWSRQNLRNLAQNYSSSSLGQDSDRGLGEPARKAYKKYTDLIHDWNHLINIPPGTPRPLGGLVRTAERSDEVVREGFKFEKGLILNMLPWIVEEATYKEAVDTPRSGKTLNTINEIDRKGRLLRQGVDMIFGYTSGE
eukprot:1049942-Amphidinium_carterae.1